MHCPPLRYGTLPLADASAGEASPAAPAHTDRRANRLIGALSTDTWNRLAEMIDPVRLTQGQVLHESGERLSHAFFPTTAVVSLLFPMANGAAPEVAVVGHEGMVGVALVMDTETTPCQAVAQGNGLALRIRAGDLRRLFDEQADLRSLLMRYTQVLFAQASQTAVCNGRHTIEQALCRWLLDKHDRVAASEIHVTHEWVASLLGVRREGVSIAAERLQAAGVIRCGRGRIRIVDRTALEQHSCECYRVVRDQFARLFA